MACRLVAPMVGDWVGQKVDQMDGTLVVPMAVLMVGWMEHL